MINLQDIHSLTDFARNTKEYAKRMKKTGRPAVLTVNGRAEFVVQDAKSYQLILDKVCEYFESKGLDASFLERMIESHRSVADAEKSLKKLKKKKG